MTNADIINCISIQAGEDRWRVQGAMLICGRDIHITFAGGEVPHIGAAALAVPRNSLADPGKISSSASVLCVIGHKDDQLARDTALDLAAAFETTVSVTVGLHIDHADTRDIKLLLTNFREVVSKMKEQFLCMKKCHHITP